MKLCIMLYQSICLKLHSKNNLFVEKNKGNTQSIQSLASFLSKNLLRFKGTRNALFFNYPMFYTIYMPSRNPDTDSAKSTPTGHRRLFSVSMNFVRARIYTTIIHEVEYYFLDIHYSSHIPQRKPHVYLFTLTRSLVAIPSHRRTHSNGVNFPST